MTLSIVCFKWKPAPGYRSMFEPFTVNTLKRMVRRHYQGPHRFICVTDSPRNLDPDIEVVPLWPDHGSLRTPSMRSRPSCYRRLKVFDPAIRHVLGERMLLIDLDCVITGDVTKLWDRPEDIVLWGGTHQKTPYNGSMLLLTAGARPHVWTNFHPIQSPQLARQRGYYGSDQAWLSYALGPNETRWTQRDGVYSFRCDIAPNRALPDDARIVFFHGRVDPWHADAQAQHPWIARHYR